VVILFKVELSGRAQVVVHLQVVAPEEMRITDGLTVVMVVSVVVLEDHGAHLAAEVILAAAETVPRVIPMIKKVVVAEVPLTVDQAP
jgi:hypothetical protein